MDGIFEPQPPSSGWNIQGLSTEDCFHQELFALNNQTPGSITWQVANLALYIPFYVQAPGYVQQVWWLNGLTIGANVQAGLYDEFGNQIWASAVVAQNQAAAPQSVIPTTPFVLVTGRYYIALMLSTNTSQVIGWGNGSIGNTNRMFGIGEQVANPLPLVATFGTSARSYFPIIGVSYATLNL